MEERLSEAQVQEIERRVVAAIETWTIGQRFMLELEDGSRVVVQVVGIEISSMGIERCSAQEVDDETH